MPPLVVLGAARLRAPVPPTSVALRNVEEDVPSATDSTPPSGAPPTPSGHPPPSGALRAPRGGLPSKPLARSIAILRAQALWVFPSIAVLAWCLFHHRATGEPLQFLRLNREFAEGFLQGVGYPWGKQPLYPLMAVFYLTVVPVWNMLGPVHALVVVGLRRALAELPRAFVIVSLALVAIVTFGLIRRTHLGLPRHAVAFAPLLATLVATGTLAFADWLSRRLGAPAIAPLDSRASPPLDSPRSTPITDESPVTPAPRAPYVRRRAPPRLVAACVVLFAVLFTRAVPKSIELLRVTRRAFQEQAIAARALREIARPSEPVLCEDGKIEVLSALAPRRFLRWQIPDVAPSHLADLARPTGSALVIGLPSRAAHLPGGRVVWQGEHLAILRYDAPARPIIDQ